MATWGAHIRIAEAILNVDRSLDEEYFLVGNVGPDCGQPNEDNIIEAEKFYDKYLNKEIKDNNLC